MAKRAYITQSNAPARRCPVCQGLCDALTTATIGGRKPARPPQPRPGDLTLCAYCGAVLVVTADSGFRVATQVEIEALPPAVRAVFSAWRPYHRREDR